MGIGLINY
jgi:hypothetical protein